MNKLIFNHEVELSRNTTGKREELCVKIDECMATPYFVIRFTDKHGWRCEKCFYDTKTARSAWEEVKRLKEIEMV